MGIRISLSILLVIGCLSNSFTVIRSEYHQSASGNSYSVEERQALTKFRSMVKDELYRDYMREDVYIISWIRAAHMNLIKASESLRKAHQWRKDNSIDTILTENVADYKKNYPFYSNISDKEKNPVVALPFGSWNIRKAVVAGQFNAVRRHLWRMLETGSSQAIYRRVLNGSEVQASGSGFHWTMIADMNGFNRREHLCIACLQLYPNIMGAYEAYYTGTFKHAFLINTPGIFDTVLNLMLPLMSQRTRNIFKVIGTNKAEWAQAVLSQIEPDQLTKAFGGTRRSYQEKLN